MGEKVPLVLPVRGDLDTSMPVTDRPLGTIVRARDLHPRRWGPRVGAQRFTGVWESPGTASLYDGITLNGTNNARARADTYEDAFADLGTASTVDLWFRVENFSYAAAVNRIGLYHFPSAGVITVERGIEVNIFGGNHTDHERIEVRIATTPTRSTEAAVVTFTGATRLLSGTVATVKQHVRVVRDGKNAYLYLNGVLDGSTSSLSATDPINRPLGGLSYVQLGYSLNANISFNGSIYGAWLRDGAFTSSPIESAMPCNPWARNVHHAFLGRSIDQGGGDYHFFDAGRFGAHARLIYNAGADITITSSNDDSAPAPAPVQGLQTWTTRTNRTASTVAVGGQLSTAVLS